MALISFDGVGISAMAGCVPRQVIRNYEYTDYFPADQVKEVVDKVGVFERRFADKDTCSSDLCCAAAEQLIKDNDIHREDIDLLVFLSQTPDYRMPATSIILQHRLGLPNHCVAFDIQLGCAGFSYALSVVYGMMQGGNFRKALILDGETRSKATRSMPPPRRRPGRPCVSSTVLLRIEFTAPDSLQPASELLPHFSTLTLTALTRRGSGLFLLHFS